MFVHATIWDKGAPYDLFIIHFAKLKIVRVEFCKSETQTKDDLMNELLSVLQ